MKWVSNGHIINHKKNKPVSEGMNRKKTEGMNRKKTETFGWGITLERRLAERSSSIASENPVPNQHNTILVKQNKFCIYRVVT